MAKKKHISQRCWKCDGAINGLSRVVLVDGTEQVVHVSCSDSMAARGEAEIVTTIGARQ